MSKEKAYFNVFRSRSGLSKVRFNFPEYYTLSLKLTQGKLFYADKWTEVCSPALICSMPGLSYAWEPDGEERGFTCVFNDAFVSDDEKEQFLSKTPLLDKNMDRVIPLGGNRLTAVADIFGKMAGDMTTVAAGLLHDIMHSYLHLLLFEAAKAAQTVSATTQYRPMGNAAQRIVELFINLLDQQFPTHYPDHTLTLRSATDYAARLSVHTNHLNRVVKQVTGKTTTQIIAGRICGEALRLLRSTDISISEVAYALGFEEVSSFSNFIMRHTGRTPSQHRTA